MFLIFHFHFHYFYFKLQLLQIIISNFCNSVLLLIIFKFKQTSYSSSIHHHIHHLIDQFISKTPFIQIQNFIFFHPHPPQLLKSIIQKYNNFDNSFSHLIHLLLHLLSSSYLSSYSSND